VCREGSASRGGLSRAGEQGRGLAGVWGVAPTSGERGRARRARERESSRREREGEARPFIERERERVPGGEVGRSAINGAIRERTWGRMERERVAAVSGSRGGRARGAGSTGHGTRSRRGGDAGKVRREGEERGVPGGPHLALRGRGGEMGRGRLGR
jgi:hypothetical protein